MLPPIDKQCNGIMSSTYKYIFKLSFIKKKSQNTNQQKGVCGRYIM